MLEIPLRLRWIGMTEYYREQKVEGRGFAKANPLPSTLIKKAVIPNEVPIYRDEMRNLKLKVQVI